VRAFADRSGLVLGSLAGLIGIGCCVGPTALALLGLVSGSVALGLGNTLYSEYGWYFRGAGLVFAAVGAWVVLRRRRSCSLAGASVQWRLLVTVAVSMLGVYAVLYWVTARLARAAG
jgi:hypothetical protein